MTLSINISATQYAAWKDKADGQFLKQVTSRGEIEQYRKYSTVALHKIGKKPTDPLHYQLVHVDFTKHQIEDPTIRLHLVKHGN